MKRKIISLVLILASLVFVFCSCSKEEPAVDVAAEEVINEHISILTLGDNLLHMPVVNSGLKKDGSYDYSHIFAKLQPRIREADIAVIGQETPFGGKEFGYSGYPMFNSPSEMGKTLVKEGFDVVLHASNHILDKQAKGVENTLEFWNKYPDTLVLGINESPEEKETVDIIEKKGAKLAMLNYTYGTNGMVLPQGKEYLINYIDEDKISKDVKYAESNADFTIAFMHWGTEYSTKPDEEQKKLAEKMCEWGVDLIIGSHPHVIEPMEWIESENGNRMLVYYSLGNFVSRQLEAVNLLGGMADVTLRYDGKAVEIERYEFVPIVTHYDRNYTDFAVYTLESYDNDLASGHGVAAHNGAVSVERWQEMVDSIFEGYSTQGIKLSKGV